MGPGRPSDNVGCIVTNTNSYFKQILIKTNTNSDSIGPVRPQDKVGCIVSVEPGFKMSHLSSLIEKSRISLPFNQKKQKIKERKMMLIVD